MFVFLVLALSGCNIEIFLNPTSVDEEEVEMESGTDTDTDAPASADTDVAAADTDASSVDTDVVPVEEDACDDEWDLWSRYSFMRLNPRYSASLPSVEFSTIGVYYPAVTHAMNVGKGTFHVADGYGEGFWVSDVYFLLEGVPPETPASDMKMTFSYDGGPSVEVACVSYWLGNEAKYTCSVLGMGEQFLVEAGQKGREFNFQLTDLPDAPLSRDMQLTMFFRWKDVCSDAGTWTGQNWPAIDSEVMILTPNP